MTSLCRIWRLPPRDEIVSSTHDAGTREVPPRSILRHPALPAHCVEYHFCECGSFQDPALEIATHIRIVDGVQAKTTE